MFSKDKPLWAADYERERISWIVVYYKSAFLRVEVLKYLTLAEFTVSRFCFYVKVKVFLRL